VTLESIELKADIREKTGKGPGRTFRRNGRIPAVLYGAKIDTTLLSVSTNELQKACKDSKTPQVFVDLSIDQTSNHRYAMLKELQTDPLSGNYLHADFYEVGMDQKISVMVPIVTVGKSIGVENGGTLQTVRHELEVLCCPMDVPENIEIDVSSLDIGDSVHIEDINVGDSLELLYDVNFTVLACVAPKSMSITEEGEEKVIEEEGEEVTSE
jgi:large subunit ribosomal protein L25